MNRKISFNKNQLQTIAVISMVIDHLAWAFLEFRSPLAQVMHLLGRFTIPIMCFFIAEGFRKTRDLRAYMGRLASFAVISIIPFYVFFNSEYGFRQNIIFDHLLSVLILATLEHKKFKKWQKVLLVILLFGVSMTIGGWPITPQLFTLAFYYGKTFKEKAKWFVLTTVTTVVTVSTLAALNRVFYFSLRDWTWYDKAYLLGFVFALPLLERYNGEKGKPLLGKYFFYGFYPIHLLLFSFIRYLVSGVIIRHDMYLWFHVICLILVISMLVGILQVKASRMQSAVIMFLVFESFYIVGFIIEIMATKIETLYMASTVEYFGELMMLTAVIVFASECGRIRIPLFVFLLHVVAALALVYSLATSSKTGFFYSSIGLTTFDGYTKPIFVHSTGYYLSVLYILAIVAEVLFILINSLIKGTPLEKRRVGMIFAALMFTWIPYAITLTGITGGYEVPGLGVVCAAIFLTICFFKYGSLDSVAIASETALGKAGEGVIIIDDRQIVTFANSLAGCIVGNENLVNSNSRRNETINRILAGEVTEIGCEEKLYEVRVEELKSSSFVQGYTIWFLDATKHRELLDEAENMAFHDALTGLYNRRQFEKLVGREIEDKKPGTLVISDMDNFKAVNDTFGHKRGDMVLTDFADILKGFSEELLYPCRIGGDEFMFYLRGETDRDRVIATVERIMKEFDHKFRGDSIKCTLSIGIVINDNAEDLKDYATLYREADKKLYAAKDNGKNNYVI